MFEEAELALLGVLSEEGDAWEGPGRTEPVGERLEEAQVEVVGETALAHPEGDYGIIWADFWHRLTVCFRFGILLTGGSGSL